MLKVLQSISLGLISSVMLFTLGVPIINAHESELTNLIANHSAEDRDEKGLPIGWNYNEWGESSASGVVQNAGVDGIFNVGVRVSGHQSGDAKWYFDAVEVNASTEYDFSNWYHSTVTSETVIQQQAVDGSISYHWLGTNPSSEFWTQSNYSFTTSDNAAKLSIFHVMAQNGELYVDDYFLGERPVMSVPQFLNSNLEVSYSYMGQQPRYWSNNTWGSNTANFTYETNQQNDNHSVKVEITSYASGDAKWFPDPVNLTPGQDYRFSNSYKSNIDSRFVVAVINRGGTISYHELATAPASSTWAVYSGTFTMPGAGVSATPFHLISREGYLIVDNYSIDEYIPESFERGLVTLSFDDGWEENINTAIPMMEAYGYKSNQFYATTFIENSPLADAEALIREIQSYGHEIGSHSITHPDLTTLNSTKLHHELSYSKNYLESITGRDINYFATPYGAYNTQVNSAISGYYSLHRTVNNGYNSPDNWNRKQIKIQNVLSTTTASEVSQWVDRALNDGTWLVLLYHRVVANPGTYDTYTSSFAAHLEAINDSGIQVKTMSQALTELEPQLNGAN